MESIYYLNKLIPYHATASKVKNNNNKCIRTKNKPKPNSRYQTREKNCQKGLNYRIYRYNTKGFEQQNPEYHFKSFLGISPL